jgi:two-component system NtrC family sensor kinase
MVLMPLLLLLAVNRWSVNYDNLLITNVQSDLRIADQYLQRILTTTGNDVRSLTRSIDFDRASQHDPDRFNRFLQDKRAARGLDFL